MIWMKTNYWIFETVTDKNMKQLENSKETYFVGIDRE
jgi:hypothetical protein